MKYCVQENSVSRYSQQPVAELQIEFELINKLILLLQPSRNLS